MNRHGAGLVDAWYQPRLVPLTRVLTPLAPIFAGAASLRRTLYATGILRAHRLPVPVIVVGNITAGGSGKTPLVAALAQALAERGRHPGIVSRGYGRRASTWRKASRAAPLLVAPGADPSDTGDEPLLLARRGFPVAVAADRAAAGRALLAAHPGCDVIIADDGLQHYALARDVEIAVVDGSRAFGNGWRLPAGPLREALARLRSVDAVVVLGQEEAGSTLVADNANAHRMTLVAEAPRGVNDRNRTRPLSAFTGPGIHAVAGIGNPARFFAQLRALGIDAVAHPFPDHHRFSAADLAFPDAVAVLMTEKDAVKCAAFADDRCWYLPVHAHIDPALVERVEEKLRGLQAA